MVNEMINGRVDDETNLSAAVSSKTWPGQGVHHLLKKRWQLWDELWEEMTIIWHVKPSSSSWIETIWARDGSWGHFWTIKSYFKESWDGQIEMVKLRWW